MLTLNIESLQLKNKTAAQWVTDNTVLKVAEFGVESDTGKFKIGDGVTAWNSLAYAGGGIDEVQEDFTTTWLFDKNRTSTFGDSDNNANTLSGNTIVSWDFTNAVEGARNAKEIVGGGSTYTVTFPNFATGKTKIILLHSSLSSTLASNVLTVAISERILIDATYSNGYVWVIIIPATDLVDAVPPSATSVAFTGTEEVGELLSGSYTYNANDGGTESGTTFQWYRADDGVGTNEAPIAGATSINYTLVSADNGKYVRLGVTPSDGTLTGSEAFSSYSGAIDVPTLTTPTLATLGGDGFVNCVITNEDASATGRVLLRSTTNDIGTASAVAGYDGSANYNDDDDGGGLSNGTTYYYWFHNTASGYNDSADATDSATPATTPQLTAPTQSAPTVDGTTKITVTIDDPNSSPQEETVLFRRAENVGMSTNLQTVQQPAGTLTYQWTGLTPGTTYYFDAIHEGDGITKLDSDPSNNQNAAPDSYTFANTHKMVVDANGEGVVVINNEFYPSDGAGNDQPFFIRLRYATPSSMGSIRGILSIRDTGGGTLIQVARWDDNKLRLRLLTDGSNIHDSISSLVLSTSTTYEIVITYNGNKASPVVGIYINGTNTFSGTSETGAYNGLPALSGNIQIDLGNSQAANACFGEYEIMQLFNQAIGAGDVSALYNSGTPTGLSISLQEKCVQENLLNNTPDADNIGIDGTNQGTVTYTTV